jgi:hypothetical protein
MAAAPLVDNGFGNRLIVGGALAAGAVCHGLALAKFLWSWTSFCVVRSEVPSTSVCRAADSGQWRTPLSVVFLGIDMASIVYVLQKVSTFVRLWRGRAGSMPLILDQSTGCVAGMVLVSVPVSNGAAALFVLCGGRFVDAEVLALVVALGAGCQLLVGAMIAENCLAPTDVGSGALTFARGSVERKGREEQ